jgi:hypothetical protein
MASASTSTTTPESPGEAIESAEEGKGRRTLLQRLFPKDTSSASVKKLVELARPEKKSLTLAVGLVSPVPLPSRSLASLLVGDGFRSSC